MSCSTTVRNTFVLLLLLGVAGPSVAQEAEEPSPQEVWFGEDVAITYAARLECSGRVPVARLVEIMDPGRDRPRQMNWVMALDADGDGFVEPGEVGAGLGENLEHQVERRMHGDVDGDDALSPREYALFVPDPGAQTNEDRVSDRQEAYFADLDRDGDRLVSRDEIADDFVRGYIGRHWGRMVSFHLGRADADADGAVDRQELTAAIQAAGGAVAPDALGVWFDGAAVPAVSASARRIVLSELPPALAEVGTSADGRAMLEAPLAPLLSPACGTQ